jgi:hypothetical protein
LGESLLKKIEIGEVFFGKLAHELYIAPKFFPALFSSDAKNSTTI